jgi:hypothetical protein
MVSTGLQKRVFSTPGTLILTALLTRIKTKEVWETIWSSGRDYVLWIALAILLLHRDSILSSKMSFEDILRVGRAISIRV